MPRTQLRVRIAALVAVLVLLGTMLGPRGAWALPTPNWEKIDPALRGLMTQQPLGEFDVIVETTLPPGLAKPQLGNHRSDQDARTAQLLLRRAGGKVGKRLGLLGGTSGTLDARAITLLSLNPRVAYISHNGTLQAQDLGVPGSGPALASIYTRVVRAPEVWALGYTGKGIGIAVLDSGVAPSNDLTLPTNRLVASVDLVDSAAPTPADPGGHGTHVAGIIAGSGYDSSRELGGAYKGVAPGANIISVRVIDANGSAKLDAIIRGIQWAVNNRRAYNIRVINLSLGGLPVGSYMNDPLSTAVEIAWHAGIVVVAAAGNHGPNPGTISTPGRDPYVITVGATDDLATLSTGDDVMGSFSGRGPTFDGFSKPDLVAPGRKIVSLYAPGSTLSLQLADRLTPMAISGANYFRLTGTSMATPVVAGVVALMLERNPSLTPDHIKFIIKKETQALSGYTAEDMGAGRVDAYRAVTSSQIDKANKGRRPSDSFARRIYPLIYGQQLTWRDPGLNGINWNNLTWNNLTWNNLTWNNLIWENLTWDNLTWDNLTWDGMTQESTWNSSEQDSTEQESVQQDSIPWQSVGELD